MKRRDQLKEVIIAEELFFGAVSLERTDTGIKPWRIPYKDYDLFPPSGINNKAEICAGVRLCFRTNSQVILLKFDAPQDKAQIDCVVDGQLHIAAELNAGDVEAVFSDLAPGWKEIIIYLPHNSGMTVTGLSIGQSSDIELIPRTRPRWITYGSSITQSIGAPSPSRTWPAIAASGSGLDLTCLGYSGNCHLEPMVGRMIRDLPADFISICAGVNIYGGASLSPRTFKPALIGMLETIRDKHTTTPLLVISPIYATERETKVNPVGFILPIMREEMKQVVELLQSRGDQNIFYLDGLELFSGADVAHLPDQLHPDGVGNELIGARFLEKVIKSYRERGILA